MILNPNIFYAIIGLLTGVILYLLWKTVSLKRKINYLENFQQPSFSREAPVEAETDATPEREHDPEPAQEPLVNENTEEVFEAAVSDAFVKADYTHENNEFIYNDYEIDESIPKELQEEIDSLEYYDEIPSDNPPDIIEISELSELSEVPDVPETAAPEDNVDLKKKSAKELKNIAKSKGLRISGSKKELIERILQSN